MHLKNLSELRKEKGLTQEGLARKASISYHTVIKLESGAISNPKIETVVKLADALMVSTDELVGRKGRI
jgi:transcriptional regulator with XRE-family HTH domain